MLRFFFLSYTSVTQSSNTYIDELLADQNESEPKFSSDKGLDLGVECRRCDGPLDSGGLAAALVVGDDSTPALSLTIQAGRCLGGAHSRTEP